MASEFARIGSSYGIAASPTTSHGSGSVMVAQHLVMIPAMVGVMLWRYDHYSR